jgi:hypothetical protein
MNTMGFLRKHGQLAQLSRDELARLLASRPELSDPSAALELDTVLEASVRLLTGWLREKLDFAVGFPDPKK